MKIKEIYDFENNRQYTSDKYMIRFIREGTWWRAYEWSAYLAHNFPNGMDDSKRLFVTKKHYVELGKDLVVVGLQLKSFEKYLPCIITDDSCFSFENDYVDVNADKFFETIGNEIVDCKKVLEDWKCGFQLSEKKKEKYQKMKAKKTIVIGVKTKLLVSLTK